MKIIQASSVSQYVITTSAQHVWISLQRLKDLSNHDEYIEIKSFGIPLEHAVDVGTAIMEELNS